MEMFERQWLAPRGLHIERLGMEWRKDERTRVLAGLVEFCERYTMIPFPAVRWCTRIFKIDSLTAWAEAHGIEHQLIGIAADEAQRQKGKECPLIDRGITRADCIHLIEAEGLDVPQKSGCYLCPFQRNSQWRALWERHPELYARAEGLERALTEKRGIVATLDYAGKVTLEQRRYTYEHQLALPEMDMDELLAYRPCVCGL